uniref:Uncharacterized protein n=1 Tax=Octopus bimaculoides TaxID=37653 RepID=A0A0L8H3H0_OCTBM
MLAPERVCVCEEKERWIEPSLGRPAMATGTAFLFILSGVQEKKKRFYFCQGNFTDV